MLKLSHLSSMIAAICLMTGHVMAESIGRVVALEGEAVVERTGKTIPLTIDADIHLLDKVITKPASKVQIMFNDDSLMSIGESSEAVMDEYVYDASQPKESSFGVSLGNGIFRIISGKITEINPERFKVNTPRSTIGIRGCELGIVVNNFTDRIMLIRIPAGHEILVGPPGRPESGRSYPNAGFNVDVDDQGNISDRPLSDQDIKDVNDSTNPQNGAGKGNGNNNSSNNNEESDSEEEQTGEESNEANDEEGQTMTQGELAVIIANKLGIAPQLSLDMSELDAINALIQQGIFPAGGWQSGNEVTLSALAYLLVKILGLNPLNPDDDASVVEACVLYGIDFTDIESALISAGILEALSRIQPTGPQLNDPLLRLPPGSPADPWSQAGDQGNTFRPNTPNPLTPN